MNGKGKDDEVTPSTSLPPCDRFTVLESRRTHDIVRCDVCEQLEADHETAGRRILSGGEIETLRRHILMATYDKLQEQRRRKESDGQA